MGWGADRLAQRVLGLAGRFWRSQSGNIGIMGGAAASVTLVLCGVVVDGGRLYATKVNQQSVNDLAAMTAAKNVSIASAAASKILTLNRVTPSTPITVTTGNYSPNPNVAVSNRFVANGTPVNAVKVLVTTTTPLYFGSLAIGKTTADIGTSSIAAVSETAAFSIGSRLASLNNGIANTLLTAMLGGSVSLSVMDYNALLSTNVNVLSFMNALATQAHVTAGTYNTLASTNVTMSNIANAMINSGMTGTNVSAASQALKNLIAQPTVAAVTIAAGKLVNMGDYGNVALGGGSALSAKVTAYQLLSSTAQIANGTNQLALNLGLQVSGLAGLTASVAVGQPMQNSAWITVGSVGATVYTAQTRVWFQASVLGTGILNAKLISVPILVDVAAGKATLSALTCGSNPSTDGSVTLGVTPSVAEAWLGVPHSTSSWNSFAASPVVDAAPLITVPLLLSATGTAHVPVTNVSATPTKFTYAEIQAQTIKTVSTVNPTQTLLTGLLANTKVTVTALGLITIGTSGASTLIAGLVSPVGGLVDPVLIGVLNTLGIKIGQVDVTVNGLRCDGAVLVQ